MSNRYLGGFIQNGLFNPLIAPTPSYLSNLFGWGLNTDGQLGIGNLTNYSSPTQVGSLTAWSSISGGLAHSLATKTDGT